MTRQPTPRPHGFARTHRKIAELCARLEMRSCPVPLPPPGRTAPVEMANRAFADAWAAANDPRAGPMLA